MTIKEQILSLPLEKSVIDRILEETEKYKAFDLEDEDRFSLLSAFRWERTIEKVSYWGAIYNQINH